MAWLLTSGAGRLRAAVRRQSWRKRVGTPCASGGWRCRCGGRPAGYWDHGAPTPRPTANRLRGSRSCAIRSSRQGRGCPATGRAGGRGRQGTRGARRSPGGGDSPAGGRGSRARCRASPMHGGVAHAAEVGARQRRPDVRRHAMLPQSWIQRENWEFETDRRCRPPGRLVASCFFFSNSHIFTRHCQSWQ